MLTVKEFGALTGVCGLVVGTYFVAGLVHERDMLRNQVQALEQLPHHTSPPPSQPSPQPTAPAAAPAPTSPAPTSTSTPVPRVLRVVARSSPSSPAPTPAPSSPAPSPTKPVPPPKCASGAVATVRVPAGLPCQTAVIGGTG